MGYSPNLSDGTERPGGVRTEGQIYLCFCKYISLLYQELSAMMTEEKENNTT